MKIGEDALQWLTCFAPALRSRMRDTALLGVDPFTGGPNPRHPIPLLSDFFGRQHLIHLISVVSSDLQRPVVGRTIHPVNGAANLFYWKVAPLRRGSSGGSFWSYASTSGDDNDSDHDPVLE